MFPLCAVVTLKSSYRNKDEHNTTCDHGGSRHMWWQQEQKELTPDQIPGNLRQPPLTFHHLQHNIINNNDDIYFDLKDRHNTQRAKQKLRKRTTGIETNTHTYRVHRHTNTHARKHRKAGEWERKILCDLWKRGSRVKKVKCGRCEKTTDPNQEGIEGGRMAKTNIDQ